MKLLKDFELLSFTQGWSCDFPGTKEEGLSHSWREWKDPTISGENCSQSKLFQNFLSEWEDSELSTAANVSFWIASWVKLFKRTKSTVRDLPTTNMFFKHLGMVLKARIRSKKSTKAPRPNAKLLNGETEALIFFYELDYFSILNSYNKEWLEQCHL